MAGDITKENIYIPKGHEAQDPDQNANGLGTNVFDGTHIDCLTVVTKPVSKVHSLDVELAKLAATGHSSQKKRKKGILDISMAPILAFNTREGRDIPRAEAVGLARDREKNEKTKTQLKRHAYGYKLEALEEEKESFKSFKSFIIRSSWGGD